MKHRATFLCTPEAVSYLCGRFGFGISDVQAILLAEYLELLMKWNRVMNLVGTRSWEACLESLISDSLHLARYLECLFQKTGGTVPAQDMGFSEPAGAAGHTVCVSSGSILSRAFMPWKDVLLLLEGKLHANGHVLFMTNEPLESGVVPSGWTLEDIHAYKIGRDSRYFCSVTALPNIMPLRPLKDDRCSRGIGKFAKIHKLFKKFKHLLPPLLARPFKILLHVAGFHYTLQVLQDISYSAYSLPDGAFLHFFYPKQFMKIWGILEMVKRTRWLRFSLCRLCFLPEFSMH